MEQKEKTEIYYIGDRFSTRYYHVIDDSTVSLGDDKYSIPKERFLDFIAAAKVLGFKAGRL